MAEARSRAGTSSVTSPSEPPAGCNFLHLDRGQVSEQSRVLAAAVGRDVALRAVLETFNNHTQRFELTQNPPFAPSSLQSSQAAVAEPQGLPFGEGVAGV